MKHTKFEELTQAYEHRLAELFQKCNGKTIVIYGYNVSGEALEAAFRRHGNQVEVRIDRNFNIKVQRPEVLHRLDPEAHIVLCMFQPDEETVQHLARCGFYPDKNWISIPEFFYGQGEKRAFTFYSWLEYAAPVDFRKAEMVNSSIEDFNECAVSSDYLFCKVFDNFCFRAGDRIFDYGCGKGGALILFERYGLSWGGIEYDHDVHERCVHNLEILGLPTDTVVCGDASKFTEIDAYNYFYCYNAFRGETFSKVIRQIETSWKRNPRLITFIYTNPFCHKRVLTDGVFHWTKTIPADFYIPEAHIYQTKAR